MFIETRLTMDSLQSIKKRIIHPVSPSPLPGPFDLTFEFEFGEGSWVGQGSVSRHKRAW